MTRDRSKNIANELMAGRWGLERAREIARRMEKHPAEVRALIAAIFGDDAELRKRASDVARRITDADAMLLRPYAEELAGVLAELDPRESRTRWHMGLVVPRVVHTREQRLRAARLMQLLFEDESNVARCSAVEGIGKLACDDRSLRDLALEMLEQALRTGTPAMKSRARHAKRRLERVMKQPR